MAILISNLERGETLNGLATKKLEHLQQKIIAVEFLKNRGEKDFSISLLTQEEKELKLEILNLLSTFEVERTSKYKNYFSFGASLHSNLDAHPDSEYLAILIYKYEPPKEDKENVDPQ